MKNIFSVIVVATVILFAGCKKWEGEQHNIYNYVSPPAHPISDAAPLCGSIKGTMLSGKTYTLGCDVTINKGDTLIVEPGVTVYATNQAGIEVEGTFLSLGTKAAPNFFTVKGITKTDQPGAPAISDPAYSGQWKGIIGGTNCALMVIKWTHIDFAGAAYGPTFGPNVSQKAATSFAVLFQNYQGVFIMEDSWLYGATDDAMRISDGKIDIMRNTFEKAGPNGGDCVNVKGGTVGTMAYNFYIGTATNGQKASNKGQPVGAPQTNIVMYNNTFVNGGYRQIQPGRGANINYEEGARGMFYNNVNINCKFGNRVLSNPTADIANMSYGNNYQYADSLSVANQFYPQGYITIPQSTDLPAPTYLPAGYKLGDVYDGSSVVQKLNPMFINYPLPVVGHKLSDINAIGNFDFHLQLNSPLVGRGTTSVQPLVVVPVDPKYGATEITPPGVDLGCFQINGKGNQH
ncbi:hypothetical protein [Mucilaginibacter sp.]|uniref:hypothetical protein n=1 Tax=Mucilaginibacter sp. TaxID=1882438 RepID=UPI003D0B1229